MFSTDLSTLPDPDLIEACLKGNEHAWEILLTRYARLIYSIPLRYGLSESDAADVFQNVSILLLKNLQYLRDRERLGAYVAITTRRECWRLIRRLRAEGSADIYELEEYPDDSTKLEDVFQRMEQQAVVHAAVDQLAQRCRTMLTLMFYQEPRPSYSEIAEQVGVPEGSIGPTRARCMEKLLKILEKSGFSFFDP